MEDPTWSFEPAPDSSSAEAVPETAPEEVSDDSHDSEDSVSSQDSAGSDDSVSSQDSAGSDDSADPEQPDVSASSPEVSDEESSPVSVDAAPIEDPGASDAQDETQPQDPAQAISLMVRKNGKVQTAWALIKAGFRVLFGKSAH